MKSTLLRPSLLLAMALALAGCGGKNTFDVTVYSVDLSGNAKPVDYDGLVLLNGSDRLTVPAKTTKISFSKKIDYGTVYNVTIDTMPAHEDCKVINPTDTAGRTAAVSVAIQCDIKQHALTVTLNANGLTGTNAVVLTNGTSGGTITLSPTSLSQSFPVTYGNAYGVSVLTPPADGSICTVANGTGTMLDADITNVAVTCTPKPAG